MTLLILPILIVFIAAACLAWVISVGNRFRRMGVKITESESGIDVALVKRYDTLTKLLEVCRLYASHEVEVFTKIIELRRGMTMAERSEASARMDDMTAKLNVVAEQYPQLRSAEVFRGLQDGIRDAEAHLQAARRVYNSNVSSFNQYLVTFPYSLIGKKHAPYEFFEAEAAKKSDVSMEL